VNQGTHTQKDLADSSVHKAQDCKMVTFFLEENPGSKNFNFICMWGTYYECVHMTQGNLLVECVFLVKDQL
jgi:hypothetical protein